jgi:hypothetical protein
LVQADTQQHRTRRRSEEQCARESIQRKRHVPVAIGCQSCTHTRRLRTTSDPTQRCVRFGEYCVSAETHQGVQLQRKVRHACRWCRQGYKCRVRRAKRARRAVDCRRRIVHNGDACDDLCKRRNARWIRIRYFTLTEAHANEYFLPSRV